MSDKARKLAEAERAGREAEQKEILDRLAVQSTEQLRYRLSTNCVVTMSFQGPVTQYAIEALRNQLEAGKVAFPVGPVDAAHFESGADDD